MSEQLFAYGDERLTPALALDIVHGRRRGYLGKKATERIKASHQMVQDIVASEETVYGINTGFGPLCTTKISAGETRELQHNILKSHSSGIGDPIQPEIAKLMLVLKVHGLSQGYSGIAPQTLDFMIQLIDQDAIPVVPCQGSVGASGDLAPLAHLFLPLIGLGHCTFNGNVLAAEELLPQLGLQPLQLGPKEGLALINGTQFIAAHALWGLARFQNCLDNADLAGAFSIEALLGSRRPFDAELHQLRPYKGTQFVAAHLRTLLHDSEIVESHKNCANVQDPYSLRCMPQVHGASRDAWLHLKETLLTEINAVTDNPIILSREKAISGGHFHGQPLALPIDYASLAVCELGSISERRTYFLLDGAREGLPKFLIQNSGLHSGLMIPQYAAAALVSENKTMCFPASADSIPTSMGQEDHVSMGSIGSRKLNRLIDNLEKIIAIELLCGNQGFEFRKPLKANPILEACHAEVRKTIDFITEDRIFAEDMQASLDLVRSGKLIDLAGRIIRDRNLAFDSEFRTEFSLGA